MSSKAHLVSADKLITKRQSWHHSALFEPEDGSEGTGEEDALDGGEGDDPLPE